MAEPFAPTEEITTLPDGTRLRLRDIDAADGERLQDLLRNMSAADIRMRFFAPLRELSPALLHRLSHPDPEREIAFAAVAPAEDDGLLGVARLALDESGRGEFALAVRSDMKGHGIGYLLLARLIERSRARGIPEMWGDVLRENEAMLQMAREQGFHLEDHPDEGELVRVRKAL
jgi:acetyltransferase